MKLCKKALSAGLATIMLLTAMFSALPAVSAETSETQLTLETADNIEPGMDAAENADWIADNLMLNATVTVSGNPSNSDSNSQYKAHLFDGEASNEWSVGESGTGTASVPKVTAEFETPQTVKEIVLANCNNPTRYIVKAKMTLTDTDGNTYVYETANIDKGGVPYGYVFSEAVHNVVKVEIVATQQNTEQSANALSNGFSYVGILDKRYSFTENKVYYAKNHPGTVGAYDDADGLAGVLVPETASTGNAYLLNGTGGYAGRRPRLVAGNYKVTLYAKLISPAVEDTTKTVLKLKYDNVTLDFNRSDFSAADEYVKIEKAMPLNGTKNADLKLEYQAGSGAVKIDRILIGPANADTPEPVQPVPPEIDPNELETELPGVSGDEYDPDGKTWIEANLLKLADPTQLVNSAKDNAEALYDGNEAVSWSSETGKSVVTADFSQLEVKPTIKKIILVSKYSRDSSITKAKITFTTADGEEVYYTAKALRGEGAANEITFKNAIQNVAKVTVEALENTANAGWAELALLDKRYAYEQRYYVEYLAEDCWCKETGVVDPPTGVTVEDFPQADWPRGIYNDLSVARNYMIWSPSLNVPEGNYTISVYAKLYSEEELGRNTELFNVETFGASAGAKIFRGSHFSKANSYEILKYENVKINSFYTDRISIYSYNNARLKIHKIVVHTDNMSYNLPEPPEYTPSEPGEDVDKPGELAFKYFRDTDNMVTLPYRLYLPADYSADKKYSFLLFLHGAGERGYGDNHFENVKIINHIMNDPEASQKFIIVAPQCANGKQWVDTPWVNGSYNQDNIPMSTYLTSTYNLIRSLEDKYAIDESRMYITGYSMGGYGTWDMITRYPDMFAAAIPICGAGDPTKAELIKDMPIWAFHSAGDITVPSSGSREMVAAIEDAGGSSIKYTEFSDDAHDAWTRAYTNEELYTWLYAQSKPICGDANGDGEIDVRDLVKLKKMIAAGEYSETADCNNDGTLSADDLVVLRKHLLGVAPIA